MILIKKPNMPLVLLVLSVLLSIGCQSIETGPVEEQAYIREDGINYGKGGDVELKLNLARPASGKGPFPALFSLLAVDTLWEAGACSPRKLSKLQKEIM